MRPDPRRASWRRTARAAPAGQALDAIAWVDLCNQFPLGFWVPHAYRRIFRTRWLTDAQTFSFASVVYDDRPGSADGREWAWLQAACADGVFLARERGWRGVCTSNFCQPHFRGMWRDAGWHQALTAVIRGAS